MADNDFPTLEGEFENVETCPGQLDDRISKAIAHERLSGAYWKLKFRHVQYGTFRGERACIIVVEGDFHAEDRRHRFSWIRLSIKFKGAISPVEVVNIAPREAYGISIQETRASNWSLGSKLSIAPAGIPVGIDIFNAQLGYSKTYPLDRVAKMKGSDRGLPESDEALWTLEEAIQEGLPQRIPPFVVLVKCHPRESFTARFELQSKVGSSMNPSRWLPRRGTPKPVSFDGVTEYLHDSGPFNSDFSKLDLPSLTTLDLREKQP